MKCLCTIECSHKPNSASATPNQVPMTRGAPTHRATSSSALPNRAVLPSSPICACNQLAAPLVASTYNPHTNKGSRYDFARGWCINTPVTVVRRPWRRILYACIATTLSVKPLDVTVTSPHRERICLEGFGRLKQVISCAADQYNRTD